MYKIGEVYASELNPHKDIIITDVDICYLYGEEDNLQNGIDFELSNICYQIYNESAWEEYVCNCKNVNSIKELLDSGKNTYPFAYNGSKSFISMKNHIRGNKLNKKDKFSDEEIDEINKIINILDLGSTLVEMKDKFK